MKRLIKLRCIEYLFRCRGNKLETESPIVLLPARMLLDKGVVEFVEAARLLSLRHVPLRMVLVGARDNENPASIPLDSLQAWQDEGVIEWRGHCDDMPALYRACDIVCLPSYREGLPTVLLEAGASGLPIVTTDVPGCRDVVRHGENGLLVPPRDPVALADAIQKIIEMPDLGRKMGLKGREIVENNFSVDRINAQTLALYETP